MAKSDNPMGDFTRMFEDFSKAQAQGVDTIQAMASAMTEAMSGYGTEIADFLSRRFAEDTEFQSKLMACRSPADLAELQQGFFQKALADYGDETGKMVEMNAGLVQHLMEAALKGKG